MSINQGKYSISHQSNLGLESEHGESRSNNKRRFR